MVCIYKRLGFCGGSSAQLWSLGQGGVAGGVVSHAPKTLGGYPRQVHGELTAEFCQLQRESQMCPERNQDILNLDSGRPELLTCLRRVLSGGSVLQA